MKKFWEDKRNQTGGILQRTVPLETQSEMQNNITEVLDTVQEPFREPLKKNIMPEAPLLPITPPAVKTPSAVEAIKKMHTVSIKPYVSGQPNMGHEKYDEVLFPGTAQMATVMCHSRDNIKTYVTGLNEFAAEVQSIENKEQRIAKIRGIRETVAYMENVANANFKVSPTDCMANYGKTSERGESLDSFWENVTMFQSVCVDKFDARGNRIETYWDRLHVDLTNDGRSINLNDVHDLAIYCVTMANGFGLIASSMQQAIDEPGYNFYLHKAEDVSVIKTQFSILRNKALGTLEIMRNGDSSKLFYMGIMCATEGAGKYKIGGLSSTPILQIYQDLDNYLNGKTVVGTKEAVDKYLQYYDMTIDDLQVRCAIKVATELRLIDLKSNGQLCYLKMNANVGKNIEDIVVYMQQPLNEEVWVSLRNTIEYEWKK